MELVSSEALEYEMEKCPWPLRREHAKAVLAKAHKVALMDAKVEKRARAFVELGVKPLDALHLALAEAVGADCFCTCDVRLLREGKQIQGLKVRTISPIELIQELEA